MSEKLIGYPAPPAVRTDLPKIPADIQLYRSDFGTWEAKVRAAGRRQAADAIRATHDIWSRLGKLPQSYLDGVADAAGIADRAPAEPVEEATE